MEFSAGGRLRYGDEVLQLEDLDLRQGDNRIQLAGDLSLEQEASNLHLSLDLPQLRQLIPEQWLEQFDGALEGELQLTGSLEQPALEGRMVARNIEYGDINLQRGDLSLNWQGADQPDVNFSLQLDRLGFGEDLLAQLSLSGQGRQAVHSLIVEAQGLAQHQDKRLALQCHGGFTGALGAAWDGECSRLDIDFALSEPQQWRLQQPLQLTVDPSVPELALSAFCLTYQNASLCSERGIEYRSDSLSPIEVVGENFAAHWFQNFVPAENLQLAGNWGVRFSGADMLSDDRRLSASLSSSDLAAIWNEPGSQLRLQAQTLGLEWTMVQQHHQLSWILDTVDSGSSRGELSLIDQAIEGSLSISGVDLGDYGHLFLAADDEVAGQLEASLAVSGTLEQPVLNGEVNLAGGRFRSDLLPVPLEDIQFQLAIRDNIAAIDGQYRAANSRGRLGGEFRWAGLDWSGNMTIAAEPLLIQPEPTMKIYVAPDLRFDFEPSRITISGSVAVPRAELEITELPEQAISVSSDTVIVGAAESEEGTALQVLVNIELQLGNRVAFEGFGLETNITGKLRLQQRSGEMMRANGRLSLVEGRYNAYGQNLVIRSGDLVFVGDIDNPQLRVEAVRGDTPETVTVGLRASGPARNPRVSLFSQPDMPQQAQLSYLITGSPPGAGDLDPQMAAAEAALNFALDSGIGSGITRRAGDALGIEDLHVSAGSTDNGTQIGLSGYVTPRLLVRYGVGVFDTINTWTLRYQVSRSVYLEAITGEASDIGVMWSFERN